MTNTEDFLLALGVGAALIAFWVALRFPDRGPANFKVAFFHVAAALVIGWIAPAAFSVVIASGKAAAAMAGIFGVLLPVLVYCFLSVAWFLQIGRAHV